MLIDSSAACSVIDAASAQELVDAGVAKLVPLRSTDLTAIHGVGGRRGTTSICVARLDCWCVDSQSWTALDLLAFVLEGSDRLRTIGNSFLRHRRATIDMGGGFASSPSPGDTSASRFPRRAFHAPVILQVRLRCGRRARLSRSGRTWSGWPRLPPRPSWGRRPASSSSASAASSRVATELPLLEEGADVYVCPLCKRDRTSWFTATPLLVHAGVYKVLDGRVRLLVRNPTGAAVSLPPGLVVAHYDMDVAGKVERLRSPVISDLSVDQVLNEMNFDDESCSDVELARRRGDLRSLLAPRRLALFSNTRLGRCTAGEFDVELLPEYASGQRQIPNVPARPLAPDKQAAVDTEFENMKRNGVIVPEPINAYGAALVVIPKPKGGWRVAMDLRLINAATVSQFYPLPRLTDCVEKLRGAKFFTALDDLGFLADPRLTAGRAAHVR